LRLIANVLLYRRDHLGVREWNITVFIALCVVSDQPQGIDHPSTDPDINNLQRRKLLTAKTA
jgi:hypothetical protein